jgi:hypothetical protein
MITKKEPIAGLNKYEQNIGAGASYRLRNRPAKEPRSTPVPDKPVLASNSQRPKTTPERSRREVNSDYWETLLF